MDNNNSNLLSFLLGTAVGIGLGILFAPDKGTNTRKRILENAESAKNTIANEASNLKKTVVEKTHDIKENLAESLSHKKETLDERLHNIVMDASYKADDVIASLEDKLKTLKAKNKKLRSN